MINADNIGKRIKLLRKQKGVSQEKMAEDLGMYQADVSNLERAMAGSGIADLFKLEMIADYFGISLVELLAGFDPEEATASVKEKAEEVTMKDYVIESVQHKNDYDWFVSELELKAPDGKILFVSFADDDGEVYFYKTSESIFDELVKFPDDEKLLKKYKSFLSGDYVDVFKNVDPDWLDICRYLVFVGTESEDSEEDVKKLIEETVGKAFKDIQVPVPDREPEELIDVDYSDLSVVYRYRLLVETNIKNPHVYDDIGDNVVKREKILLAKLKAACGSEEAYKVWKKDLIDAKVKEVMEKEKIITVPYMFIGVGDYKAIIPEEMLQSFYRWIDGNGSAFHSEPRPATKQEIRTYVSQHIADDLQ